MNLVENNEDQIGDLNRRMNQLKIGERKSERGVEEIKKRQWINRKEKEEKEVTNRPQYLRANMKFM